jgi:phosphoribosylformimino-5-aminoimidazole carboxamide ribotide isomerase
VILYPAIDLKDGRCVRLLHGDLSKETVFNTSPGDQARAFQAQGFTWLHVVDLNGAVEGRAVNIEAVSAILEAVSLPVQLGGGIRTLEQIETWIEAGISRVILGTVAVREPELVKKAARLWPEQIAVGIDARGGMVATQGWLETSDIGVVDLARKFEDAGVAALIVTDIGRDGAMTGVNVEQVGEVAAAVSIPGIASGGVASIRDIEQLKSRPGVPIAGCILGRSLYEGAIDPAQALTLAAC